jgi:hypothetical protein
VYTDLVRNQLEATAAARGIPQEDVIQNVLLADQPTKQFVPAQDIAALVLHLCGPHSSAITGACLSIDGARCPARHHWAAATLCNTRVGAVVLLSRESRPTCHQTTACLALVHLSAVQTGNRQLTSCDALLGRLLDVQYTLADCLTD